MIETVIRSGDIRLRARVRRGNGPALLLAHSAGCDKATAPGFAMALICHVNASHRA